MIELLRKRRSIRKFLPNAVEPEKIELLKEALLRAPTSRNRKPWHFIFVDDKSLLDKIALAKESGSSFVAGAPLAVVILADPEKSDVWVEDSSIAATIMKLTAEDLGLGSCWIQIRLRKHDDRISSEEYLRELLQIPSPLKVASVIALGYPGEDKKGNEIDQSEYQKIHHNQFEK